MPRRAESVIYPSQWSDMAGLFLGGRISLIELYSNKIQQRIYQMKSLKTNTKILRSKL